MADQENSTIKSNEEDLIKQFGIGLRFQGAFKVYRGSVIVSTILFLLFVSLSVLAFAKSNPIWDFVNFYIFLPTVVYLLISICCLSFGIYAWTRTSLRYVYIDVFYVTVFRKMMSIIYCIWMLAVVFMNQDRLQNNQFYLVMGGMVWTFVLLDDLVVISFIAGLRFKFTKFVKMLTKYSFIRTICYGIINVLIAVYYLYDMSVYGYSYAHVVVLILCIKSAVISMYYLRKQICKPNTFQMKNLDEMEPPKDIKIQTAFKIIDLKEEVKNFANDNQAAPSA